MSTRGPQTLDGRWQHIRQALAPSFPAASRDAMEQLFYAGASSAIMILMSRPGIVDLHATMARLISECRDFAKPKVVLP